MFLKIMVSESTARKRFLTLTTLGVSILALALSLLNATSAYAQSGCIVVARKIICPPPAPPAGPGPGPSHPEITFSEGTPFQIPTVAAPTTTPVPPTVAPVLPTLTSTPAPPTVTSTPVPPTVTPTPLAATIALNELLSNPRNTDWNSDRAVTADDEWIELYNGGSTRVDLANWQLVAISGTGAITFTLPPTTTIPAQGYAIFFHGQTKLELNGAGQVRLLFPNNNVADAVTYPALRFDQTYARSVDGGGQWTANCVPSPDARNCQLINTITSDFNLPFFQNHIADPSILNKLDWNVVTTNFLLALILALAMGFFGNLLNDSLETHEEHVQRLLAPVRSVTDRLRRAGSRFDERLRAWRPLFWLSFVLRLAVILLLYGFILAFLDPNFTIPDKDGWLLILALALSAGLVSLTDDIAQYLYLRLNGLESVIRVHPGNFILVIATTLFSRFTSLAPGLLVGSPAGIEEVKEENFEIRSHLLAVGSLAVVAIGAWALTPLFAADAWFKTLFLLIFGASVQTLFFEMIPLRYLHGRGVFQFNRILWLVLFVVTTTVFLQTMLNPHSSFASAFNSPNMAMLAIVVSAFCVFSTAVWFYLQRLEKAEAAKAAAEKPGS